MSRDSDIRDAVCDELWRDICRTRLQYDRTGSPVLLNILIAQVVRHNAIMIGDERPVQ